MFGLKKINHHNTSRRGWRDGSAVKALAAGVDSQRPQGGSHPSETPVLRVLTVSVSTRQQKLTNDRPSARMGYFFWRCWSVKSHRSNPLPSTLQAIAIALGYPLEFDGKTLFAEDTTCLSQKT